MAEDEGTGFIESMKKVSATLRDAGVPHLLGGGLAAWARGGPGTGHDVDFLILPEDVDRALAACEAAGLRSEQPPEGWLVKVYDGDVLVDLIYDPSGSPVTPEMIERGDDLEVMAMRVRVAALEDVMVQKLLALTEQEPDFTRELEFARSLREQIDWEDVRRRTGDSPFAKAFFVLVEELGVVERPRS